MHLVDLGHWIFFSSSSLLEIPVSQPLPFPVLDLGSDRLSLMLLLYPSHRPKCAIFHPSDIIFCTTRAYYIQSFLTAEWSLDLPN